MKLKLAPVHPEKIKLVQEMLQDQNVNELYLNWVRLAYAPQLIQTMESITSRNMAFYKYCQARDEYLGLKPVKITPTVSTRYEA